MTTETAPAEVALPTLVSIALDTLPAATRDLNPARKALADAMLAAIADGKSGTTYTDAAGAAILYDAESKAAAAAAAAKRLVAKVHTDAATVIRSRIIANGDAFGWLVYLAAKKPAKGKK
jgi:hypothetical protein